MTETTQSGTARIVRDEWGAAHITASTQAEAYFGVGWCQAHDDPRTLVNRLLTAGGELASVHGEPGITSDLVAAQWCHVAESRAGFERLEPGARAATQAWADGINAFLDEHPDHLDGVTVRAVPWHAISVSRQMLWWYSWIDAVQAMRATGVEPDLLVERGESPNWASNQVAVAPSRTRDGHAMLLSDIHTGPDRKFEHTLRLIEAGGALTEQDWIDMALDEFWIDVPPWQAALRGLPFHVVDGRDLANAIDVLVRFDGQAHAESGAAHLWLRWRERLAQAHVAVDDLVDLQTTVLAGGPLTEPQAELVIDHLRAAVDEIQGRHGQLDVPLGEVFRAAPKPFDLPIGGIAYAAWPPRFAWDSEGVVAPLRVMFRSPPDDDGRRVATHGGWNMIVTVLSDPIRSWSAILPGQHADPESPHAGDRLTLLSQRRVRPTWFDPTELAGHTVSTQDVPVALSGLHEEPRRRSTPHP